jgi:membrane-associated phospholipid phosphatase
VLAALGDADQAVLHLLRKRGHFQPIEGTMKALGHAGEHAAVWTVIGVIAAAIDVRRRGQWLVAGAVGPAAIGINFAVKLASGRQRPLIEEHPPLARAPTKLSFPSAHATSSVAAATALGRVEPGARPALFALASAICIGRPYLGMHYPSDVLAGSALGALLGSLAPGLGGRAGDERQLELEFHPKARARVDGGPPAAPVVADPSAETA